MTTDITFTNGLAEFLGPLLLLIRATGFFEATVFIPSMSALAVVVFMLVRRAAIRNGTFATGLPKRFVHLWQFGYFTLCFIVTNSTAVAFKTMMWEETDYETFVWFLPWVSPLHFYISAVAGSMLWVIVRRCDGWLDKSLVVFVQIGLLGGYYVGIRRLIDEPFELTNPTTGFSGVFFILWFLLLNIDLALRMQTWHRVEARTV